MEEEKDDDEISIDLSKITNFFKRKKKDEVKGLEKEAAEVRKEIEEKVDREEERARDIIGDEEKLEKAEKELKEEGIRAWKLDKEKGGLIIEEKRFEMSEIAKAISEHAQKPKVFDKKLGKTREDLEDIKEDIEKEDEEEISIDLSRIKGFFKGKAKEKKETAKEKEAEEGEEASEEEIAFDFSKLKNIFKRKGSEKESKEEDEISLDARKIFGFINKHKVFFLLLIPIILSIYLRSMPAYLPATDDWARNSVYNYFRNQISAQVSQEYPNLPDARKNILVEEQFKKFLKENKEEVNNQIKGTSAYFKSRFQDDKGQTYLIALDPYYWWRFSKNIIEKGYPGDIIKEGVVWDMYMFAPNGRQQAGDMLHAYFQAYLYKFLHFFNRDLELVKVAFFTPVILMSLAVIPAFFIVRKASGSNFGALIASVIVAIHPSLLGRTIGGISDTDPYVIIFPLMSTWLFLEAFEARLMGRKIILSSISGIFVGLFAFAWSGWWYIFDFILVTSAFYILYYIIVHREEFKKGIASLIKQPAIKNTLIIVSVFIIASAISTTIFTSFDTFESAYAGPFEFVKLKQVAITTVWPNVYTTVAEQNPASLNSVIYQTGMGSYLLFFIGLMGIALMMLRKDSRRAIDIWFLVLSAAWFIFVLAVKPQNLLTFIILISLPVIVKFIIAMKEKDTKIDVKISVLLILWFAATIYASVKGVRFTLMLVPAFGIAFGAALGICYRYISKIVTRELHINRIIANIVVVVMLSLLLVGPVNSAKGLARNHVSDLSDAWYNSLKLIDQKASKNAIINSWWDFGHWFKAIGNRPVTFDGTSQNSQQAHWIGNVLLTDNEDLAVGTLRMLDCSGYTGGTYAFDEVEKVVNDSPKSIDILHEIMQENREKASSILAKYGFDSGQTDSVLKYTHCEPPEDYFITSDDMVGKSGVWAHFGSWNFNKALIYNVLKSEEYKKDKEKSIKFLEERFNYSKGAAEDLFYEVQSITDSNQANNWIAQWPGYVAGPMDCSKASDEELACQFIQGATIQINLTTMDANIKTQQGVMHPNSIAYAAKDNVVEKEFDNNTVGLSVTLIPAGDSYKILVLSEELAASMYTRLFFMEGHGLSHFKKFSDEKEINGARIIIWKVDWEGNEKNKAYFLEEEKAEEKKTTEESKREDNTSDKTEVSGNDSGAISIS